MLINLTLEVQIAFLLTEKVTIPNKQSDFAYVFSKKLAIEVPKHSDISKYVIDLKPGNKFFYDPIYNLNSIELETLKIYIETNLANDFIWSSKSSIRALIIFI